MGSVTRGWFCTEQTSQKYAGIEGGCCISGLFSIGVVCYKNINDVHIFSKQNDLYFSGDLSMDL